MPIVDSTFRPPGWLRNGHLQTILPVIWPRRLRLSFTPERLELADGDFLDLAWARAGGRRVAILSHGLESDAHASYIRGMAKALHGAGWDVLAWSFRGCGPHPNRLLRFYHSGETGDLSTVIQHAADFYPAIALVGFSLGGNVTLKYLGAAPPHPRVVAAVAISAPVDLAASAAALDRHAGNRLYLRRFLGTLIAKVEAKARLFPGQIDVEGVRRIRSFQEFDDRFTARLHGFRDAADYWTQSSSRQYLSRIGLPTLLLNARDDPFLAPTCFPWPEAEANPLLFLEAPAHGGHVGFMAGLPGAKPNWLERRVANFLPSPPGRKPS
jgi:predicted alpha/beta-fold hydrolase